MFDCHLFKSSDQKKRWKKGHSLSYWFERMMEFGDTSDEEAPPPPPKNRDLSKTVHMQIVAMLQGNSSLKQGSVTAITKSFGVACCTVHLCATGIINSPEFYSQKNSGRPPIYLTEFVHEGVKDMPLRK